MAESLNRVGLLFKSKNGAAFTLHDRDRLQLECEWYSLSTVCWAILNARLWRTWSSVVLNLGLHRTLPRNNSWKLLVLRRSDNWLYPTPAIFDIELSCGCCLFYSISVVHRAHHQDNLTTKGLFSCSFVDCRPAVSTKVDRQIHATFMFPGAVTQWPRQ